MTLLHCENLRFAYDGRTVCHNINFTLQTGDYLCIVGENGSGKSTLMKGILQLKKPSGGTLRMATALKADQIGYLPQQTDRQKDCPAVVQEVVLSGCLNRLGPRPFYGKKEKALAAKKMEQLGISHLQKQSFRDLSGGQKQRVLLARALCATKQLLVLDEPTAGLDPLVTRELYELITTINQDLGLTILMASHDLQSVVHYADKILHLDNEQLFFGTSADYLRTPYGRRFSEGEKVST